METKRSILVIILLIVTSLKISAQKNDYDKNWKAVEAFEKKGLTKSALAEVMKIFDMALTSGNEAQQVKSAMYQMKYRDMVEEDNNENNIFYLDTLIAKTKAPAKNILQCMQAKSFFNYRERNRYRLYNRTALAEEKSKDITTWSIRKLNATISSLFKASLKNEALLKNTPLNGYDAILSKGENTRNLRPTLYDFLAHQALSYFMNSENDVTSASYKFILNNEKIFAPVNEFIKTKFSSKDSSSLYFIALGLLQDILKFHINDANPDALVDADLIRLDFANRHGIFNNKESLYEESLKTIEANNSKSPVAAQAMYLRAVLYSEKGNDFDPFNNKKNQYEKKRAKELCELAISSYPGSEGAMSCQLLLDQIITPTLECSTEQVNIPGQPFRGLLKYKNSSRVYLRIVKTSRDDIKELNRSDYEQTWKKAMSLVPQKNWNISLPDPQDYQEHSVEIKIDALPAGIYYLLASLKPDFTLSQNIMLRQVVVVSNISYILNNKNELYVLDRDNGQPLANASVQLWEEKYNYNSSHYEQVKKEKYTTDKNGFIKFKKDQDSYNISVQVKYNNDELFLDDDIRSYYYNSYESPSVKKTFFFTDRAIYRPGQTVFFKGIVINTDSATKKSSIVSGYRTKAMLFDANSRKIAILDVQTNGYGSYNGSFRLPEGLLNGSFYIRDSANNSTSYFRVEEYKRPKFFVEVKKPSGTYRINDSITVKGNAKAFAGNNIDGAKVVYRVVRKVVYPDWWEWGYYRSKTFPSNRDEMEITNGETTTDASGSFSITFKAIPDETVDKKSQPTFQYEVSADITDINGESRSGNTLVAVAYRALKLDIVSAYRMEADSIKTILIKSSNMNDLFEKATVHVSLHKLRTPDRMFRERFWEMPDQFLMSFDEYKNTFPYDIYSDEDRMNKWPLAENSLERTDTTRENGKFSLMNGQLKTGWYKLIATTKDKYGEEVSAEKFILITDGNGYVTENLSPLDVKTDNNTYEPGDKINYSLQTAFDKIWAIHYIGKTDKSKSSSSYQTISSSAGYRNEIPVTESDRGGIYLNTVFVQHNRVYNNNTYVSIPWTNKELNISYETFRDKLLPGSEETWKLKISGNKAEKVAAETLVSMYDASLDQFQKNTWATLRSLFPANYEYMNWQYGGFIKKEAEDHNTYESTPVKVKPKSYDELLYSWGADSYYKRSVMLRGESDYFSTTAAPVQGNMNEVVVSALAGKVAGVQIGERTKKVADGDGIYDSISTNNKTAIQQNNKDFQVRKNFNETAFFFPVLYTDADGNVAFSFTIPEALTEWKLMTYAHTKELAGGYDERKVVTQKPLMVQPNAPRFLREGDQIEFSAKIVNMSDKEITGTAQLELFDASSNKPVDGWFKNVFPNQYFTVAAGQSVAVKFPIGIPANFNSAMTYRIKAIAKDASFSDGEEAALPVLTNRMLVTESMPLNMRTETTKNFRFEKLLNSGKSETLSNHAVTVEYTSNPAWYAVQALPYLMEYPYECAEQTFNRYYANALATYISNASPKIKAVFEAWKTLDTAALLSNLQKNEELKSVLLQETPWVMDALNENQQKKNIALLFDLVKMSAEKNKAFAKLKEMQGSNGGFTWFKGGPDDRYITQYIITGIGHLKKLNALTTADLDMLKEVINRAVPYLDKKIKEDYDYLLKNKIKLSNNNLSFTAIQYLYMRSFFSEYKVSPVSQTAYNYYRGQSQKFWLSNSRYMQAMIALSLKRTDDSKTALAIIKSLRENAIYKEEMGMYWKDLASGGYYWYQAPIESQAMMIEAFTDIDKDTKTIDDLKTWLLKQKQTQNWKTTRATAEACYALLLNGSSWLSEEKEVQISLGNTIVKSSDDKTEAGTGYFKKTIDGEKVKPEMGNINVSITPSANQHSSTSTSWGSVYWQYFEDLDKITPAETPLKLVKKLFIEKNSDSGPVLQALTDGDELHVGDKVKVRIELKVDRDMEYIHMKDMRASCMEPVNVLSQYKWQGGLGYYESTKDASTNFFFGWLPRGSYVFEYPMFVTHAGNFSNGITTIQCMYAPEFTSHSEGIRVSIE